MCPIGLSLPGPPRSDLRLELGLHRAFDEAIKRQLDPIWHQVSAKTKAVSGMWVYGMCHMACG